jgi:hypothetical protein
MITLAWRSVQKMNGLQDEAGQDYANILLFLNYKYFINKTSLLHGQNFVCGRQISSTKAKNLRRTDFIFYTLR